MVAALENYATHGDDVTGQFAHWTAASEQIGQLRSANHLSLRKAAVVVALWALLEPAKNHNENYLATRSHVSSPRAQYLAILHDPNAQSVIEHKPVRVSQVSYFHAFLSSRWWHFRRSSAVGFVAARSATPTDGHDGTQGTAQGAGRTWRTRARTTCTFAIVRQRRKKSIRMRRRGDARPNRGFIGVRRCVRHIGHVITPRNRVKFTRSLPRSMRRRGADTAGGLFIITDPQC